MGVWRDNKAWLAAETGPWSLGPSHRAQAALGLGPGSKGRARPLTVPYCPLTVRICHLLILIRPLLSLVPYSSLVSKQRTIKKQIIIAFCLRDLQSKHYWPHFRTWNMVSSGTWCRWNKVTMVAPGSIDRFHNKMTESHHAFFVNWRVFYLTSPSRLIDTPQLLFSSVLGWAPKMNEEAEWVLRTSEKMIGC
jgi:hypothetical protein